MPVLISKILYLNMKQLDKALNVGKKHAIGIICNRTREPENPNPLCGCVSFNAPKVCNEMFNMKSGR